MNQTDVKAANSILNLKRFVKIWDDFLQCWSGSSENLTVSTVHAGTESSEGALCSESTFS